MLMLLLMIHVNDFMQYMCSIHTFISCYDTGTNEGFLYGYWRKLRQQFRFNTLIYHKSVIEIDMSFCSINMWLYAMLYPYI